MSRSGSSLFHYVSALHAARGVAVFRRLPDADPVPVLCAHWARLSGWSRRSALARFRDTRLFSWNGVQKNVYDASGRRYRTHCVIDEENGEPCLRFTLLRRDDATIRRDNAVHHALFAVVVTERAVSVRWHVDGLVAKCFLNLPRFARLWQPDFVKVSAFGTGSQVSTVMIAGVPASNVRRAIEGYNRRSRRPVIHGTTWQVFDVEWEADVGGIISFDDSDAACDRFLVTAPVEQMPRLRDLASGFTHRPLADALAL